MAVRPSCVGEADGGVLRRVRVRGGQWAARPVEFGPMRRLPPFASARIATALHPAGAAAPALPGGPAAAFTVPHGADNGPPTVVEGTPPLALCGPADHGPHGGPLSVPARVARAGVPLAFGPLLDRAGLGLPPSSAGLVLASTAALLSSRGRSATGRPAAG